METKECGFSGFKMNGFLALFLHLVVLTAVIIFGFIISVPTLILSVCLCLIWFIMFAGYMELEPNEARAMVFFGKYKGTFKETGFFWVNPFLNKKKLSLRARNLAKSGITLYHDEILERIHTVGHRIAKTDLVRITRCRSGCSHCL